MVLNLLTQIINKDTIVSEAIILNIWSASDNSTIDCIVELLPEKRKIHATVCFPFVSSQAKGGGISFYPEVNDKVLCILDNTTGSSYVIAYIPSSIDPYNKNIQNGSLCIESTKIELGTNPTEPAVLGNVAIEYLTEIYTILDSILKIILAGNLVLTTAPNSPTAPNPSITPQIQQLITKNDTDKSKYLTTSSTNIVSQQTFVARKKGE